MSFLIRFNALSKLCVNTQGVRRLVLETQSLSRNLSVTFPLGNPGVLKDGENPRKISNKEWEKRLTPEQFYVAREKGTEMPFTGVYTNNHDKGMYHCVCCGSSLFSSKSKFDSGSGWPSFTEADGGEANVVRRSDYTAGMSRVEVLCKNCNAHLGHVFPDGPKPTGERFCINSVALEFTEE